MTDIRQIGVKMLSTVINNPKNIETFEKHLHNKVGHDDDLYKWCTYQIVGLLLRDTLPKPERLVQTLNEIKSNKLEWNSNVYENVSERIEEFDNYLVHPFEVVEGVTSCPKCHNKKTWSIQKQTRSSDEPMTTFSRCVDCGYEWSYAG